MTFDPKQNLMEALSSLDNEKDAIQWYTEYLKYHKGIDQGVNYMISYLSCAQASHLREWFNKVKH